ncbi:hypothetical protein BN2475_570061 [Paraburkholderia ribeironis]|uniref:Uncharacterized protein n=1 Tax=Paraburkholderia ribeironis TaxID=1247936 RepID=A0A1N7SE09_9BURK|nr:hypothetical protein BN2475_570061 [Paraburkholderia ribeironis]
MKEIELAHEFLDPVALTPTHLAMFDRVAFDRRLDAIEVFCVEGRADSAEYLRKIIDKLLVREPVGFDEVDVAGNGMRPLLSEPGLFGANEVGKIAQRTDVCVGHDRTLG